MDHPCNIPGTPGYTWKSHFLASVYFSKGHGTAFKAKTTYTSTYLFYYFKKNILKYLFSIIIEYFVTQL